MECREVQKLIVPFIKRELSMEEANAFFKHIDQCPDCKDELEVYYILILGLKQLDEDASGSFDLHGQFEQHLEDARNSLKKRRLSRTSKYAILFALITILAILIAREQEQVALHNESEKKLDILFEKLPKYDPLPRDSWDDDSIATDDKNNRKKKFLE